MFLTRSSRSREFGEAREQRSRQVSALQTAVNCHRSDMSPEKASYYEVLDAQQQLFPARLNLARAQRDQLLAVVALYKGLRRRLAGRGHNQPGTRSAKERREL